MKLLKQNIESLFGRLPASSKVGAITRQGLQFYDSFCSPANALSVSQLFKSKIEAVKNKKRELRRRFERRFNTRRGGEIMRSFLTGKLPVVFLTGLVLSILTVNISAQNMFRKVNDFDGDGRADFAVTRSENGLKYWWIWQSTAGLRLNQWGLSGDQNAAGDFDGDGKTDLGVWRTETT